MMRDMGRKWRSLFVLVLLFCFGLAAPGRSQTAWHWEFAGWYGGGCYPDIEFDPRVQGRVYLVSDVNGIWRSDTYGDKWFSANIGLGNVNVATIAVAPSDSKIVYAATVGGLFLSRGAGKAWQACDTMSGEMTFKRPLNHRSIAVSAKSSGKVCVGTALGAVFYSEDFGSSWKVLGGVKNPFGKTDAITAVVFSDNDSQIFAASLSGLMKYSFDTDAWQMVLDPPGGVVDFVVSGVKKTLYACSPKNSLYISDDAGKTWNMSSAIPYGSLTRVSVFESESSSVIAVVWQLGFQGGVLISRDRGATWVLSDSNMQPDALANPTRSWAKPTGQVMSVKVCPYNSNIVFRTDLWGIWRSVDGGASWRERIIGAPNTVCSDLLVTPKNEVYAATMDNGLLKSANGGKSYKALFPSDTYSREAAGHVWRVLMLDNTGDRIIATSSPWDEDINQVILSNDAGGSFSIIRNGLPTRRPRVNTMWGQGLPRAFARDPKNPDTVYLGIDGDDGGGLFISRDGGQHWERSLGQPGFLKIYNALAVDPTDPARIFWGTCGNGVYMSSDAGLTWKRVFSTMPWVFDMAIDESGVIYAGGDGPALYASYDHGARWGLMQQFTGKGAVEAIAVDRSKPGRIAVSVVQWNGGAEGKIYLSEDAGKTWSDITGDQPPGSGAGAMTFDAAGTYLYMGRYAGSIYRTALPVKK